MNNEEIIEKSLMEAFDKGSWYGLPLEKCMLKIKKAMNIALEKKEQEIITEVKGCPIDILIGHECVNSDDFPDFINKFVGSQVDAIKSLNINNANNKGDLE